MSHASPRPRGTRLNGHNMVVTIVTPTFNHERYIGRCLESAIAQTDGRWELIVVDDGSTDRTGEIVQAMDDPRIRYVYREHLGIMHLADSYNLALEMATGEFIAVLEGDDFWPADKIERQLGMFDRPEIVLTWGRVGVTDEAGDHVRTTPSTAVMGRMRDPTQTQVLRMLLKKNVIPASSVICRRDALIGIGGFQQPDGIPTTDYPTWLELCRVGRFSSSDAVLGFHRKHRGQVTVLMKAEMDLVLDSGTRFIERLSDPERASLGVSMAEAHDIERDRHGYLSYEAGRAALAAGKDELARAAFRKAMRSGSVSTRAKASLGLGCSYSGLDLERLITAANWARGR